jgi:threonine/homoserine/homoserine lactone efflux protein
MSILLFAAAIFCAAILMNLPPGPVQFEIWREAMAGRRGRAAAVVIGAVAGDIGLALAAAFGLNPWSKAGREGGAFFILYAALLIGIGVHTLRQTGRRSCPAGSASESPPECPGKGKRRLRRRWACLRGAALVVLNPLGAASWAMVLAGMTRWGASLPVQFPEIAIYSLAVGAGVAAYPSAIILFAPRMRFRTPPLRPSLIPRVLGGGIIGFGLFFLFRAARLLVRF